MTARWAFDHRVAAQFASHAQQHIPSYHSVIDDSVVLAERTCAPDSAIAEIGCATGETLRRLHAAGFANLTGVDCAAPMLAHCDPRHARRLLLSSEFPAEYAPYRLVLANWTLHFLEPVRRVEYFRSVFEGLERGGYLMLTDKCVQSDLMRDLYHQMKRELGVSEAEIEAKARSLVGVMFSMPVSWVVSALEQVGFKVDIWRASIGFVTFLAQKP